MEKCIGCELCAGVCPARVHLRAAAPTTTRQTPISPGERYGYVYEINYLRCIHCDLCVEACPTEAITESKLFEFSFTNRRAAIYTKAELLVDDDGAPAAAVGGLADGEDQNTSGWMRPRRRRATPTFEGRWAGAVLGYGVRAPALRSVSRRREPRIRSGSHGDER